MLLWVRAYLLQGAHNRPGYESVEIDGTLKENQLNISPA